MLESPQATNPGHALWLRGRDPPADSGQGRPRHVGAATVSGRALLQIGTTQAAGISTCALGELVSGAV
jgi:hypothetical protein